MDFLSEALGPEAPWGHRGKTLRNRKKTQATISSLGKIQDFLLDVFLDFWVQAFEAR